METPRSSDSANIMSDLINLEDRYINRELSWLQFNSRVLEQASDQDVPLLERLNFLRIFGSNLDEFFMKRVGGLKRHIAAGVTAPSVDGMTPERQLKAIRHFLIPQMVEWERVFFEELKPQLGESRIELITDWSELSAEEMQFAERHFREQIFPVLTPLAVDPGHPFPFISNLSTSLGVSLRHPEIEEPLFARVKISDLDPQWLRLDTGAPGNHYRFLLVRELIQQFLHEVFPNMEIRAVMPFRVTRNADLEIDEEEAEDLLELIREELRQRRVANVVRLEHGANPDAWILNFLIEELSLTPDDVYEHTGELYSLDLPEFLGTSLPELKYQTWHPATPASLPQDSNMFSLIRNRDVLVHHPFESFALSVERFVREAVEDDRVVSIKMTVYRVGDESPLIPLLIEAAQRGKDVVCLVELKARFEEQRNITWAQKLENSGVHVVYGIPGLKIHAKTLLIVRKELEGIRCYAHLATGNYHAKTANLYTDVGLFTSKSEYTSELVHFFNYLTGRSLKDDYQTLLVAPLNMNERFISMIRREIEHKKAGRPARIVAKMNSLEDRFIIQSLYEASQAGVQIDLLVRGICCLRPGVKGLSENIRVVSVVGRLLEHSRIYFFQNGAKDPLEGDFYIGSADWMGRNLHRRVEVIAPVSEKLGHKMCWEIMEVLLNDNRQAWDMQSDGTYVRRRSCDTEAVGPHETLMRLAKAQANGHME